MKCSQCNEELKEGSIICPNCGNKIEVLKEDEKESGHGMYGIIVGSTAIISSLIILSIKSQLPAKNFFLIYLGIFVCVFFFISVIYVIFRK
jgi:hypothetical protein